MEVRPVFHCMGPVPIQLLISLMRTSGYWELQNTCSSEEVARHRAHSCNVAGKRVHGRVEVIRGFGANSLPQTSEEHIGTHWMVIDLAQGCHSCQQQTGHGPNLHVLTRLLNDVAH